MSEKLSSQASLASQGRANEDAIESVLQNNTDQQPVVERFIFESAPISGTRDECKARLETFVRKEMEFYGKALDWMQLTFRKKRI
jgi:hypothetical protein